MTRWEVMAAEFGRALQEAAVHFDPVTRREKIAAARRALQQFTAAGNVAIEGLEKPAYERSPARLPYKDD